MSYVQCYCSWRFLGTNFTLLAFSVIFCPSLSFFEKVTLYFVTNNDPNRTEFCYFWPPSIESSDNSLSLTSSLSPVEEQVSVKLVLLVRDGLETVVDRTEYWIYSILFSIQFSIFGETEPNIYRKKLRIFVFNFFLNFFEKFVK